ncbi:MAG: ABC transporter ATP-binding protein [Alphaproteobacteria bacterium]
MTDSPAIQLSGVAKHYALHRSPRQALAEHLSGRTGGRGRVHKALQGIDLTVPRGEMIGVLGRNGSGKTTLLQLIAGILRPTEGEVAINGSLGAILELGTGFNPQLTGRENIFIAGAARGLTKAQIAAKLDEIIAFADIGPFIDEPVRVYSSGMFVRLAFAVSTAQAPEVLLIDEALAVGDVFFRQKCYRRLHELRAAGTTIVLVSHAIKDVEELCDRAIVLERGRIVFDGNPVHAIREYVLLSQPGERAGVIADAPDISLAQGTGEARCLTHAVTDMAGQPCLSFQQGERARFTVAFETLADIEVPVVSLMLRNARAILVHGKDTTQLGLPAPPDGVAAGARIASTFELPLDLAQGEYTVEYALATLSPDLWARRDEPTAGELGRHMTRVLYVHDSRVLRVGHVLDGSARRARHHGLAELGTSGDLTIEAGAARAAEG